MPTGDQITALPPSSVSDDAGTGELAPDLLSMLVCPRDHKRLRADADGLCCADGHRYDVVDGIPIMLLDEVDHTHSYALRSLSVERREIALRNDREGAAHDIHPFVQNEIVGTNGQMYASLLGRLKEYPIPQMRLPQGEGQLLLDLGCNWGRWCVAAARRGYKPVGIDPSLEAVLAARRVTRQMGASARFVVGDARYLPFHGECFGVAFSYSVLQHFGKADVALAAAEMGRVLASEGTCKVQMLTRFGLRSFYNQLRRGFREAKGFDERYWGLRELKRCFEAGVGPSRIEIEGFFSANAQSAEARLLPRRFRAVVRISDSLRFLARICPPAKFIADSVYVESRRR